MSQESKYFDRLYMPTHILLTIREERVGCINTLLKLRHEMEIAGARVALNIVDDCINALRNRGELTSLDTQTKLHNEDR